MSGLYLLVVLGVWGALSWALWKGWRRSRAVEGGSRRSRDALALLIGGLWFGVSFWYAGGQKVYYDMQVNRMCKQDGGVKVYETVKLPAERFDKYGQINFYKPTQKENALGSEYVFKDDVQYYKRGNPEILREYQQVLRRSDGKQLGEGVVYVRRGGDLPGPWHHSSYPCPARKDMGLVEKIFVPTGKE